MSSSFYRGKYADEVNRSAARPRGQPFERRFGCAAFEDHPFVPPPFGIAAALRFISAGCN
jgi:hypothetical protein